MKKYLVVLAGSPRGGQDTWNTLYEHVLDHLDADLAICTGDKFDIDPVLYDKAKYRWIFEEPEDWLTYYQKNFKNNWNNFFLKGKTTGLYNSGSIHFAIKDIILKNYLSVISNYEYLIYTRFDQFYTGNHFEIISNESKIYIPDGEDYFGIGDRHAIVSCSLAEKFLGICQYIDNDISTLDAPEYLNCETAYLRFLKHEKLLGYVQRYPRKQFTSATSKDETNWRIAKYKIYFFKDLLMKYPDEFLEAIKNSLLDDGYLKIVFFKFRLFINYIYLISRKLAGSYLHNQNFVNKKNEEQ